MHGYGGAKKVRGIKRRLLVDTLGTVLIACVSPASVCDREGAKVLLAWVALLLPRLGLVWAAQGYTGERLAAWARRIARMRVEVVRRADGGFRHTWALQTFPAAGAAVRGGVPPVGGGKDVRLAGQVPAHRQGLRVPASGLGARHLPRDEPDPVAPPGEGPVLPLFRRPLRDENPTGDPTEGSSAPPLKSPRSSR